MKSLVVACALFAFTPIEAGADPFDNCAEHLPFGVPAVAEAANTTEVCHEGYAALVDDDALVPRWVAYHLTGAHSLGCLDRTDDFHGDENLPQHHRAMPIDYQGSGYDQGHQAPAQDFAWDAQEMHDSFSMANMAPQLAGLNRAEWERLEETVRAWATEHGELIIYVGPVLSARPQTIGPDQVAIPSAFWKVIIDPHTREAIGFLMPQKVIPKGPIAPWEKSIAEIESAAGVDLPLPEGVDPAQRLPVWRVDLSRWRKLHQSACPK